MHCTFIPETSCINMQVTYQVKSQPGLEPRTFGSPARTLTTELLRTDILTDSHPPVNPVTHSPSWQKLHVEFNLWVKDMWNMFLGGFEGRAPNVTDSNPGPLTLLIYLDWQSHLAVICNYTQSTLNDTSKYPNLDMKKILIIRCLWKNSCTSHDRPIILTQ